MNAGSRLAPDNLFHRKRLKYAVNICSMYGLVSVLLHVAATWLTGLSGGNFLLFNLLDMISSVGATLLPAVVLAYMGNGVGQCIRPRSKKRTGRVDSALLVVLGVSGCLIANLVSTIIGRVLPKVDHTVYLSFGGTAGDFLLLMLASDLAPALCEEYACRGYLYSTLARYGHLFSVVFSSLVFGMLHGSLQAMIFAFMCGMLSGCIRKTSNRFMLCVIIHFTNNFLSTIGTFVLIHAGSDVHTLYFRIITQAGLLLYAAAWALLRRRRIRVFYFRPCPYPLRKREKAASVLTSPVFLLFIIVSLLCKLT